MSASVIVIGAGIIGSSVAFHLSKRGARVTVLERDAAPATDLRASASCARATGGFRVQYGTEINAWLSLLAREELLEFEALTGVNPGYEPRGYVFLAQTDAEMQALEAAIGVQRRAGLEVSTLVDRDEIRALNPALNLDEVVGGSHCPWDGFVRPLEMRRGYQQAAEALGARFAFGAQVRLERDGNSVAVLHDGQRLEADVVVNAAGAWAADVLERAGLSLPVVPVKRQIAATVPTDVLPAHMPMTIFAGDGFHLRVRDGRVLLLMPWNFAAQDLEFDASWLPEVLRLAHARVPVLEGMPVESGWAGLYEVSPDGHALIGAHWDAPNLILANGSSGHGVMHSPAIGRLVSELIVDGRASSLDIHALRPERFLEGEPISGNSLL